VAICGDGRIDARSSGVAAYRPCPRHVLVSRTGASEGGMGRVRFGLAIENFTAHDREPDFERIRSYALRAEALGFDSLWAWDHMLLGSQTPFPFLDSLSTLAGLAAITERVELGTGVLVLPLRNPVVLAKVTTSIDRMSGGRLVLGVASGWYAREFEAVGVPFDGRGAVFERNLEVLSRFWLEDQVTGEADGMVFKRAVMLPKSTRRPRPRLLIGGYVDRVLRRAATKADGWLTYFYTADGFGRSWAKVRAFADRAGRDPGELQNVAQLPICVDASYEAADRRARAFVDRLFDCPPWSESTPDSAIRGTPEQCAEQLAEHVRAGVQHIALVPCDYEPEQLDAIAADVLPLMAAAGVR
jgi:probable F420-dependent oxidoreductase